MTPTLTGRVQTRTLVTTAVSFPIALAVTPFVPNPAQEPLLDRLETTAGLLAVFLLIGLCWEALYQFLQRRRWDEDWPSILGLITFGSEALALWFVAHALDLLPGSTDWSSPARSPFLWLMGTTWVATWLVMQGPLRVVWPRWRLEGGRFLGRLVSG